MQASLGFRFPFTNNRMLDRFFEPKVLRKLVKFIIAATCEWNLMGFGFCENCSKFEFLNVCGLLMSLKFSVCCVR